MRVVVSKELVPAISAFNAEDPSSAVLAAEAKVSRGKQVEDGIGSRVRSNIQ